MFFTKIETKRLVLRNISADDRKFIFKEFSNNYVNRFLFDAEQLTEICGADEILSFYTKPEPRNEHRWVLHRKPDGQKIGTCGFHLWNASEGSVEIGYDLLEKFTGQGYMAEALKAIITFAKTKMDVRRINAIIYTENAKSVNAAIRNGFVLTDKIVNSEFRGEKYLHHIYSLEF